MKNIVKSVIGIAAGVALVAVVAMTGRVIDNTMIGTLSSGEEA